VRALAGEPALRAPALLPGRSAVSAATRSARVRTCACMAPPCAAACGAACKRPTASERPLRLAQAAYPGIAYEERIGQRRCAQGCLPRPNRTLPADSRVRHGMPGGMTCATSALRAMHRGGLTCGARRTRATPRTERRRREGKQERARGVSGHARRGGLCKSPRQKERPVPGEGGGRHLGRSAARLTGGPRAGAARRPAQSAAAAVPRRPRRQRLCPGAAPRPAQACSRARAPQRHHICVARLAAEQQGPRMRTARAGADPSRQRK